MSNLVPAPEAEVCTAHPSASSLVEALPDRAVDLGALKVRRLLPVRDRRLIGPWCFFDRFGPLTFANAKPMDVAPHPHIGLQTVTWLLSGEVVHNDSLGSECIVKPGRLSLMTAGKGIAHTEETPTENSGELNGVQLWVALPDTVRAMPAEYVCTQEQPVAELKGLRARAILGSFQGEESPGRLHSKGVGVELQVEARTKTSVPLEPGFEYGLLMVHGDAQVRGELLHADTLYYLGAGAGELDIASSEGSRLILIGGEPFGETILMWWNFVARTQEEITAARTAWENHELFGDVPRYKGERLRAPTFIGRPIASRPTEKG